MQAAKVEAGDASCRVEWGGWKFDCFDAVATVIISLSLIRITFAQPPFIRNIDLPLATTLIQGALPLPISLMDGWQREVMPTA